MCGDHKNTVAEACLSPALKSGAMVCVDILVGVKDTLLTPLSGCNYFFQTRYKNRYKANGSLNY